MTSLAVSPTITALICSSPPTWQGTSPSQPTSDDGGGAGCGGDGGVTPDATMS